MQILRSWNFKWWEIGILKVCLISLGILLGVYFYDVLTRLMWLWWILFAVTGFYFIAKWMKEGSN